MIEFPKPLPDLRTLLIRSVGTLVALSIVLAIATFLNLEAIEKSYAWSSDPRLAQSRITVWGRLLFPVAWILIVLYFAAVRFLMARLQRADDLSFKTALCVSVYSAIPLVGIGFLFGLYYAIFPYHQNSGVSAAISILCVGIAWVWEGFICVPGLETFGGLSRFRAVLTWLSPVIFSFCFCSPFLVLLIVMGGG